MALVARQIACYLDTFSYFEKGARDSMGNRNGYAAVFTGQKCKLFTSTGYDEALAAVGRVNQDTIQTSDSLKCDIALPVKKEGRIRIDDGPDGEEWYEIVGEPKRRRRSNSLTVFLKPTSAPTLT